MAVNNPIKIPNPTEGIIRSAAITDVESEQSSVQDAVNVHYDRMGSTTVRKGLTVYSAVLAGSPKSLGVWNNATSGKLLAQVGTDVYAYSGGSWSNIGSNASNAKIRYAQFINYTYMVNGSGNDAMKSYDGTTFGTANTGGMPKADYIAGGFFNRLWSADASTNTISYSMATDYGDPLTLAGDITLSIDNGQNITGLKIFKKALLVFMEDSIWRIFGPDIADPYPAYFVGTYSQESVVQAKDSVYFHHSTGFYRYSESGEPQELSKRIKDIVDSIPRSNYDDIFGWADDDNVYWHVGQVTVEGRTYKNLVVRYTISSNVWTTYEYFNKNGSTRTLTCAITYDDNSALNRLVGVSDGNVANINTGNTDLGDAIFYDEVSRWFTIGELQAELIDIRQMSGISYGASGATLEAQIDQDNENVWRSIGTYNQDYVTMFNSIVDLPPFSRIRFRKSGVCSGSQPIFDTIEIVSINSSGLKSQ